jgi:hypothetical protein
MAFFAWKLRLCGPLVGFRCSRALRRLNKQSGKGDNQSRAYARLINYPALRTARCACRGKGQQDVQGQPSQRRRGVELPSDRDERKRFGIEGYDQLGELGQRSGQAGRSL